MKFFSEVAFCNETHFLFHLYGINGVAPVVSGPVLDELYLLFVRRPIGAQELVAFMQVLLRMPHRCLRERAKIAQMPVHYISSNSV